MATKKETAQPVKAVAPKAKKKQPPETEGAAGQGGLDETPPATAPAVAPPALSRKKPPNTEAIARADDVKGQIEAKLLEVEALISAAFPEKTRSPRWALKRLDEFRKDVARHLDKTAAVQ